MFGADRSEESTHASTADMPALSVVVPVRDEASTIGELSRRLAGTLAALGVDFEVILVDDGSTDATWRAISRLHRDDPRFVGLSLSRNFGHQLAITAGLEHARGGAVAVMDGDLQDPPEALASLLTKFDEGYDVVYAVRASRPEGLVKRLAYWAFYRILRRLSAVEVPLDAGDFGVMSRRVVDVINALPERRRFVRGLRAWVGFRQAGVPVERGARHAGKPKFTLGKLFGLALDGLFGCVESPLRPLGMLGAILALAGSLGLLACTGRGVLWRLWPATGVWVGLATLVFVAAQLLSVAILGEYMSRILDEVRGRPRFVVRGRVGLASPRRPGVRAHAAQASRRRARILDRSRLVSLDHAAARPYQVPHRHDLVRDAELLP